MKKEELTNLIDQELVLNGFKKKGNYWVINGEEITKMVNLQKSQFGNSFYINYGYILKSIPLSNMMHIYNRVASSNYNENKRIKELLDLENKIPNEDRILELKQLIRDKLVRNIQAVNTEEDLLNELKKRPRLNDISIDVKKHFGLV